MAKKSNPRKNKHLTLEERKVIEDCLGKRMTFKAISQLVQKDPTTISYEIKHHRQEHRNSFTYDHKPCPLLLKAPFVCNGCSKRHCSLHGLERHVELDTVVGRIAGKVIMTVHFTSCNFMAGILL